VFIIEDAKVNARIECGFLAFSWALNIIVRLILFTWLLGAVISGGVEQRSDGGNQITSSWERQNVMARLRAHWPQQEILPYIRSGELRDYFSYEIVLSCEEAIALRQTT